MSIWQWRKWLPQIAAEFELSLGEGSTPLIPSRNIGRSVGLRRLMFKLETTNPSGSYKDRFAAAAISQMRATGQNICVATSSGNTGSALAAYCAAVSIPCRIAIVETAPESKLLQMMAYGAELIRVRGFGIDPEITSQTFQALSEISGRPGASLQISAFAYSPLGMSGVQSISYELAEQVTDVSHVFVPAGGGGLTLAVARGFDQLVEARRLSRAPTINCVQPVGNATIVGPLREGADRARETSLHNHN